MKKLLKFICVASNIAIIVDLVTTTYFRVRGARQKTTVTNLENDEVWEIRRVGHLRAWRDCIYTEGHQKISDDAEEENQ